MSIKTSFSIKDLENLSGVKAHTIRIWEKRYNILKPERSDSNIRTYNLNNLQKLLNVTVLNNNGIKISKIADFTIDELRAKVQEIKLKNNKNSIAINNFKIAMLNFDQPLFEKTYNSLINTNSFQEIFLKEFIPLLTIIGDLWSTNTINPVHERFISTLVKQKILVNIERIQSSNSKKNKIFILFLPLNEMHDIGLLYLHFELLQKGYKSIFLGSGIPIENLIEIQNVFDNITFVSYFTVEPQVANVLNYLKNIDSKILSKKREHLHILGKNTKQIEPKSISNNITIHDSIEELLNKF